jgi:hypothetical protein
MSDQIERVIRSLRHLWAQPDATIEQFAAEAVAALRPELESAERYRQITAHVTANNKEFYFFDLPVPPPKWYHGSILEHFNKALDAARQEGK